MNSQRIYGHKNHLLNEELNKSKGKKTNGIIQINSLAIMMLKKLFL